MRQVVSSSPIHSLATIGLLSIGSGVCLGFQAQAEKPPEVLATPETIAGKTIQQYAEMMNDKNRAIRLRAVKFLRAFGATAAGPSLIGVLDHGDRAVVYTSAVHLGRIGGKPLRQAVDKLAVLTENDDSLSLRMAGSFAL